MLVQPLPRAILLDAGFTLTFCDGTRIAPLAAAAGVTVSPEAIERAENAARREIARYVWAATREQSATMKGPGGPGFFLRLLEAAGALGTTAQLAAAADAIWTGHLQRNVWARVGAGVDAAMARLRAAGIRMAVVSNSEGTIEATLREIGLGRHLDTVVDSWIVGVAKPDPRIFRLALDRLGVAADDALMVGDTPAADIDGARAAGIRAVLIDPLDLHPAATVPRVPDLPALVTALLGPNATGP